MNTKKHKFQAVIASDVDIIRQGAEHEGVTWSVWQSCEDFAYTKSEEKALMLCKAVNSHEALLEACKLVIRRMVERGCLDHIGDESVFETVEQAIEQAE